jgi:hypothetical protein
MREPSGHLAYCEVGLRDEVYGAINNGRKNRESQASHRNGLRKIIVKNIFSRIPLRRER